MISDPALEAELAARIDPWLAHMRWRGDYDAWRSRRLWQENYEGLHLSAVQSHAGGLSGALVLDVGSGMGGFAVALARDGGARVIPCDFNPAYVEIARLRGQRYHLDMPALSGAGEHLPFPAARFDIVTAWDVIEHVQDPESFMKECARVLRPGGYFFFTATNRLALRDPHYHLFGINYLPRAVAETVIARQGRVKAGAHQDRQKLSEMHYFTLARLIGLAQQHGFSQVTDLRAERAWKAARTKPNSLPARLARLQLLAPAYSLYRLVAEGTFELVALKAPPEGSA